MSETRPAMAPVEPDPEPEAEPEPVDEGTVCPVCGRKGRAEGHH
jgi:hypothetical protein